MIKAHAHKIEKATNSTGLSFALFFLKNSSLVVKRLIFLSCWYLVAPGLKAKNIVISAIITPPIIILLLTLIKKEERPCPEIKAINTNMQKYAMSVLRAKRKYFVLFIISLANGRVINKIHPHPEWDQPSNRDQGQQTKRNRDPVDIDRGSGRLRV